jgi:hypothetical protein
MLPTLSRISGVLITIRELFSPALEPELNQKESLTRGPCLAPNWKQVPLSPSRGAVSGKRRFIGVLCSLPYEISSVLGVELLVKFSDSTI